MTRDPANGLETSAQDYVGQILFVRTSYGYGWANSGTSDPSPVPDFHIELIDLWWFENVRRGGVAIVREPGHQADGLWVVFSTRHTAPYNFTDKPGEYNIVIGVGKPGRDGKGWPVFADGPLHSGWGEISAQ